MAGVAVAGCQRRVATTDTVTSVAITTEPASATTDNTANATTTEQTVTTVPPSAVAVAPPTVAETTTTAVTPSTRPATAAPEPTTITMAPTVTPTVAPEQPTAGADDPIDAALSMVLPPGTCGSDTGLLDETGTQLTDGRVEGEYGAMIALEPGLSLVTDMTGDGRDDAVLMFECSGGGAHGWRSIVVAIAGAQPYALAPTDVTETADLPPGSLFGGWFEVSFDGSLSVIWDARMEDDPLCCPSYSVISVGPVDADGFRPQAATVSENEPE